jgi:hypothetical protein
MDLGDVRRLPHAAHSNETYNVTISKAISRADLCASRLNRSLATSSLPVHAHLKPLLVLCLSYSAMSRCTWPSTSSQLARIPKICFRRVSGKTWMSCASSVMSSSSVESETSSRDTPSMSLRADRTARTKVVTATDVFATVAVRETQATVMESGSMVRECGNKLRKDVRQNSMRLSDCRTNCRQRRGSGLALVASQL